MSLILIIQNFGEEEEESNSESEDGNFDMEEDNATEMRLIEQVNKNLYIKFFLFKYI